VKSNYWLVVLLTLVGLCTPGNDHWWGPWSAAFLIFLVPLVAMIYEDQGPGFAVPYAYFSLMAVYAGSWRNNMFMDWHAVDRLILRSQGLEALAYILGAGAFFAMFRRTSLRHIVVPMFWVLLVASCVLPGGLVGNYGMNASVLAMFAPMAGPFALLPTLFFVLHSGATTPILVFGVTLFWIYRKYWRYTVPAVLAGAVAVWKLFPNYLDDSARYQNWWLYLDKILDAPWFGHGAGSFAVLGPAIQGLHGEKGNWLVFAHNEYLQIAFEYGGLGLLMAALVLGTAIYRYRSQPETQATLFGLAACSLTNFPLRLAVPAFIIVLILKEVPRVRT
jgi:hypothetical protein